MATLDFDPSSLREWMAGVGLLRIVSDTTNGRMVWRKDAGRYRLTILDAPEDLASRCAGWMTDHCRDWHFAGAKNAVFTPVEWRQNATSADGLEARLWCAIGHDAVMHADGEKVQAPGTEYGHGGGHQHWLKSMREAVAETAGSLESIERLLSGNRLDKPGAAINRWDPACERDHAYSDREPAKTKTAQDAAINALAAIGFASCPSAPAKSGLLSAIVVGGNKQVVELAWPLWTEPIRSADLEAALCCRHSWPVMRGQRWISGQLFTFSRGELREPQASRARPGGSHS